jgi:adenylyltransferase/sulfurtransferase
VWFAGHGPCYRCVFPEPPPPDSVPSCATGGVLGVLCAAIGSVQVAETIKLIVGQGDPLVGRILVHDSLRQSWDTLRVRQNPACPLCGDQPTIHELVDYEAFCGVSTGDAAASAAAAGAAAFGEVSARELADLLGARDRGEESFELVDVRDAGERAVVAIPGARAIHLEEFRTGTALGKLPDGIPVVVLCKSGVRSAEAARLLSEAGRSGVRNLRGGVLAWVHDVDPSLPVY